MSPNDNSKEVIDSTIRAAASQLLNLANYQAGSIVSRQIIAKKTGTVTLFAFDTGQGLSEHTAPFDALVYILEGEAKIMVSKKVSQVIEGEIFLLPAHQPHALRADKKFKMLLIMIRS